MQTLLDETTNQVLFSNNEFNMVYGSFADRNLSIWFYGDNISFTYILQYLLSDRKLIGFISMCNFLLRSYDTLKQTWPDPSVPTNLQVSYKKFFDRNLMLTVKECEGWNIYIR